MKNVEVYTLKDYEIWKEQFEKIRNKITLSNDKLASNYSNLNLNLNEQEDATIIFIEGKIIAFSFLFVRSYWREFNVARTLNRFWIDPEYRSTSWTTKHPMTVNLGYSICDVMFEKQLVTAKNKNYDFIFVSRTYPAKAWQYNFVKKNTDWQCENHVVWQIIKGNNKNCWHHCVWLRLNTKTNFPFPSISIDEFKKKYLRLNYEKL